MTTFATGRVLVAIFMLPSMFFPAMMPFTILLGVPLSATGAFFEQVVLGRSLAVAGRPALSFWPALAGATGVFLWLGLGCLGPFVIAASFFLDGLAAGIVIWAVTKALEPALSMDNEPPESG